MSSAGSFFAGVLSGVGQGMLRRKMRQERLRYQAADFAINELAKMGNDPAFVNDPNAREDLINASISVLGGLAPAERKEAKKKGEPVEPLARLKSAVSQIMNTTYPSGMGRPSLPERQMPLAPSALPTTLAGGGREVPPTQPTEITAPAVRGKAPRRGPFMAPAEMEEEKLRQLRGVGDIKREEQEKIDLAKRQGQLQSARDYYRFMRDELGWSHEEASRVAMGLPPETAKPHNLQKAWVKLPGQAADAPPEMAFIDPQRPGEGYLASSGERLPTDVSFVAAPSGMGDRALIWGEFGNLYRSFRGLGWDDAAAKEKAGEAVARKYGISISKMEQDIAIKRELSGIGGGRGIGAVSKAATPTAPTAPAAPTAPITTTEPAPPAPPRPQMEAIPAPAAAPTPGTPSPAAPAPTAPVQRVVPSAKPPGSRVKGVTRIGTTRMTDQDQDFLLMYLGQTLRTIPGGRGGAAGQVGVLKGQKILSRLTGLDPLTLQARVVQNQALAKQLGEQIQRAGAIQRLNEALDLHGDMLIERAGKILDSGSPLLNRYLRDIKVATVSDPNIRRYIVALNEVQREYAYLTAGGAQSKAMLPVTISENMDTKIIPGNATLAETISIVQQIKAEANRQEQASINTAEDLIRDMKTGVIGRALGADRTKADLPKPIRPGEAATKAIMLQYRDAYQSDEEALKALTEAGYK